MMAFDISTAKPVSGFDIKTAQDTSASEKKIDNQTDNQDKVGVFEALGKGAKRGVEQVALGVTQRVMEYMQSKHAEEAADLEARINSGEIPATEENLSKLADLKKKAEDEAKAISLAQGFEQSQREKMSPITEQRPVASFVGNVAGQMAAIPTPASKGLSLLAQTGKGAVEGGVIGYAQPTTENESSLENAGLGAAISGAVPTALKAVTVPAGAAYRALTGQAVPEVQKLVNYSDQNNLPLMTSDVIQPQTFAGRAIRDTVEKIPFAGTGGQRASQQTARIGQIQKLSDEFGQASDDEIYKSLVRKDSKISKAAGERYQKTISAMGDAPIQLSNTISRIDDILQAQSAPGVVSNPTLVNTLTKIKQDLSSGQQTLQSIRENRTYIREAIKGDKPSVSSTEQRAIDSVYKALTDDMTRGVEANLGPEAAAKMRQADAIWAREANEIKNTKLKNIFQILEMKLKKIMRLLRWQEKKD